MSQRRDGIVIAIDGPAGSGKSSTAREVASQLGYRHLDSGAFYRTITLAALERGIPPEEWPGLERSDLEALGVESEDGERGYRLHIQGKPVGERIRQPDVNAHVSSMAAVPAVRDWLLDALREAGRAGGLVSDGRDIGTVVFPDAELKVFLVCDPPERARRRLLEQGVDNPTEEEIAGEIRRLVERDRQDAERETAPLVQAPDAIPLDTTGLGFEEQVARVVEMARGRMG